MESSKAMTRIVAGALAVLMAGQSGGTCAWAAPSLESEASAAAQPFDRLAAREALGDGGVVVARAEPWTGGPVTESGLARLQAPDRASHPEVPPPVPVETAPTAPERPAECYKRDVWDDGKGGLTWLVGIILPPIGLLMLIMAAIGEGVESAKYASCQEQYPGRLAKYKEELALWRRHELARQGDAFVIRLAYSDQVTAGELRAAGYAVEVLDDGDFRVAGRGRTATGWEEITRLVRDLRRTDGLRQVRERLAAEKGDFVVFPSPLERSDSVEARAATVAELRQAGFEVRLREDGEYGLAGNGGEASGREAVGKILEPFAAGRMRARVRRFAEEGDRHEVTYCPLQGLGGRTVESSCDLRATVAEIRQAGYGAAISPEGGYVFTERGYGYTRRVKEVLEAVRGRRSAPSS